MYRINWDGEPTE